MPVFPKLEPSPELFIDRGRVQSCLIALPVLAPFIVFAIVFSGDQGGNNLLFFLVALTGGFLVATYALLTAIDWIGKHI